MTSYVIIPEMTNILYLAYKIFLKGSKKAIYSLSGIILGISVLVVSFSLMDGYRNAMEKTLKKIYPPLLIRSQGGLDIPPYLSKYAKVLKEDFFEGFAISKKENLSKFVFCRAQENQKDVVLGKKLAENLKIKEGDQIIFVYKKNLTQEILNLRVDQIKNFGLSFVDENYLLLPISLLKEKVSSFGIYPDNYKKLKKIKNALENEKLYQTISFEEITKDILSPLKVVEWSIGAVLSLITIVSLFHLITKLLLDLKERKITFAILYALGMKPKNIFFSFFIYSFILGLSGIFFGLISGILIVFFINSFHLFSFSKKLEGVYFVEEIILRVFPESIFSILFLGIFLIFLTSVFTYLIIKRIKIIESLRFE